MRVFLLLCLMLLIGTAWAASEKDGKKANPNLGIETVWGPDAFGYIARDSNEPNGPPVDWIDISAIGTVVNGLGDDNIVGPFNTGFNFRYYWYDVASFYVGSNGYIRFSGGGQLSDPFTSIPNPSAPNDIICPYTADFDPGSAGTVYYWSNNVDTLIVSWDHIPAWLPTGSSGDHNFQIVLSMVDTSITFNIGPQSGTFSNTNGMVGIEDLAGNIGIYNYPSNAVPANYSIKFYYPPVILIDIHDMAVTRVQNNNSGGFFVQTGGTLQANATIRNTGNQNEGNFYAIAEVRQYPSNTLVEQDSFHVAAINAGETLDITFSETWTLPNTGNYYLRVRTNLTGDMVASNNQIDVEMRVVNLPGELSFDDGTAEQTWSWNGGFGGMAVYYVPPVYPVKITELRGYLGAGTTSTFLEIYDDDGPDGQPGSVIANFSVTATTAGWVSIDLSSSNLVIQDGGVYAAWRMNGTTSSGIGLDQNTIGSRQTWEYTGVWAVFRNFGTNDAMLRLSVEPQVQLNPPQNLMAMAGLNTVELTWEAPATAGEAELAYDDGTAEGNLSIGGTAEGDIAVRFTPNVYPSTVLGIKVNFAVSATGMTSADWTIWGGTSSGPGASLATANQVINRGAFEVIDVSSFGIQISADDFFISYFEPNGQTLNISWDTGQPSANRSWVNAPTIGFPWQTLAQTGIPGLDNDVMIRAIVLEGSGPNARVVELSPNGESRPFSIMEIKQQRLEGKMAGIPQLSGAVSLTGENTAAAAVGNTQNTLEKPAAEVSNPSPLERIFQGFAVQDLEGYNIYKSTDGTNFNVLTGVGPTTLNYTDNNVMAGNTYWYYVTAVYPEGESDPSNTVMIMLTGSEPLMNLIHTPGDLNVAIFNDGSIGADNVNFVGPGVTWKGQNGIFVGGPIFGTGTTGSVNGLIGSFPGVLDIVNVTSNFAGGFTSDPNFDQISEALLSDAAAPTPYGVHIVQKSYSNAGEDFVFVRYGYVNNGGSTLTDFYAGVFVDWDIDAITFTTNQGGYALIERLVYQFDAGTTPYYYGVAVLDDLVGYKSHTGGTTAGIRTESFPWISSPDPNPIGAPGDFRSWQGTGPEPIAVGDTLWRTFAIVAGDDLAGIRANAAAAAAKSASLGWTGPLGIGDDLAGIPQEFKLEQNYPNPFNPTTTIKYALKENVDVSLKIYNVLGQVVKTLVNTKQTAGFKEAQWDGTNEFGAKVASGIYIYRIQAGDFVQSRKMILMK